MISWLTRLGVALDQALNVLLLNGEPDQTISYHAALAQEGGKRWGCWLCWALARLVQREHCRLQLLDRVEPTSAALRAGVFLLLLAGLLWLGVHWALSGIVSVPALFAAAATR